MRSNEVCASKFFGCALGDERDMVVLHNYGIAILMCFVTMICWGSWANTQKLTGQFWPFQLFYWDYAIGVVLATLFLALTMGSFGDEGRSFLADILQADTSNIGLALLSGAIFNIANILLVAAIDIAGMAVAFPVAIGLALVIGVVANFLAAPIGNAGFLFAGVALVAAAIIVDAIIYKRSDTQQRQSSVKGIVISILSGLLMGCFYRFLAASMSDHFSNPDLGKLTSYSAAFIFSLGLFLSNFIFNTFMMVKPLSGNPVSYKAYFRDGNTKLHLMGILGGVIWSVGLTFNLVSAGPAGYAISYGLGQGATLVAALWGVFVWKEFAQAPAGSNKFIYLMFFLYVLGLSSIIVSRFI